MNMNIDQEDLFKSCWSYDIKIFWSSLQNKISYTTSNKVNLIPYKVSKESIKYSRKNSYSWNNKKEY